MNVVKRLRSKIYATNPINNWDANISGILYNLFKTCVFQLLGKLVKDKTLKVFIADNGWINIPPEHALPRIKWEHPKYDTVLFRLTKNLSKYFDDLHVMDIGANIGDTAISMLNYGNAKRVICIEPCNYFYKILLINTKEYNIDVINCFINDDTDKNLQISEDSRGNAIAEEKNHKIGTTLVRTLDDVFYSLESNKRKKIRFIKIDVEGYDLNVIKSGSKVILKERPIVFFEIHSYLIKNNTSKNILDIISILNSNELFNLYLYDGWGTFIDFIDIRNKNDLNFMTRIYQYSSNTKDIWFDCIAVQDDNLRYIDELIIKI